jgi:hypothetical protein
MNTIIALRGIGNSGKSTTIRLLHGLMLSNGYILIRTDFTEESGDFISIFSKDGKLIGVTSTGDTFDAVSEKLAELVGAGCTVCVCACRSRGATNVAAEGIVGYETQYIEKQYEPSRQDASNNEDARILLEAVETLILGVEA